MRAGQHRGWRRGGSLIAALGATWLVATPARGQDDADTGLDTLLATDVQTTASRSATTSSAAPALVISLRAEDLRRHGIRTLAEAYQYLSLGMTVQDPLGDPEVGARSTIFTGDQGKHVLLLVDGHTTNDQQSGESLHGVGAGMPLELVDHIEIALGPGSVLYGSNAMLAVINVVTKSAKDRPGVQVALDGDLSSPVNSAHEPVVPFGNDRYLGDLGKGARLYLGAAEELTLFGRPAEVTTGVQIWEQQGPTYSWGPQYQPQASFGPRTPPGVWVGKTRESEYTRSISSYTRVLAGDFALALHTNAIRRSSPFNRFDSLPSDFDDSESWAENLAYGVDLSWQRAVSAKTGVLARAYADDSSRREQVRGDNLLGCLDTQANVGCVRQLRSAARWAGLELQSTFDWFADGDWQTLVGVDGRVRRVQFENGVDDISGAQRVATFGGGDRIETTLGLYGQQVARVAKPLTFNVGARLDLDQRYGSRASPRAAAILEPWTGGAFKVIYSEAFRAPTSREQDFTHPFLALAAPDLKPETVRSGEVVLSQRVGTHSLTLGAFLTHWSDVVVSRTLEDIPGVSSGADAERLRAAKRAGLISPNVTRVTQFQNAADLDQAGFQVGYEATLVDGRLAYGANLSVADSHLTADAGDRPITVAPALNGNARVSYELSDAGLVLGLASSYGTRRLADVGANAGFTPNPYAPPELTLRGTMSGPLVAKGLSWRASTTYAFARTAPYVVGPVSSIPQGSPAASAELAHVNRVTVMLGLAYETE